MESQLDTCKNCEEQFEEGFKFCPHCGQQTKDKLTVQVLFYNTISNYFSFDARFFRSFVPLMTKPGFLPEKFVNGKRLWYIHPAQIYLFISVIFFFIFSFYIRDSRRSIDEAMQKDLTSRLEKREKAKMLLELDSIARDSIIKDSISKIIVNDKHNGSIFGTNFSYRESKVDSLIDAKAPEIEIYKSMGMPEDAGAFKQKFFGQLLKFHKERSLGAIYQTFFDSLPVTMFFLLPIFALFLKMFYYKKGRYAYHLVFSFYFFSFLFAVMSLILGINRWLDIPDWIDAIIGLSMFIYLLIAVKRFYKQGWFLSYIKSSMVSLMFFISIVLTSIVLGLFAFLYY